MADLTVKITARVRRMRLALAAIRLLWWLRPVVGTKICRAGSVRLLRLVRVQYRLGPSARWRAVTYRDLVMADNPSVYWRLGGPQ